MKEVGENILMVVLVILFIFLVVSFLHTFSDVKTVETTETYIVTDKLSEIGSVYVLFLDKYKTVTYYYLILEGYGSYEVSIDEYSSYNIGDEYNIITTHYERESEG